MKGAYGRVIYRKCYQMKISKPLLGAKLSGEEVWEGNTLTAALPRMI